MITYFVQVNVCWLLFYGAYFALLSRETFFRLNRYWLIVSLLAGLVLPLIAPSFAVVEPTSMAVIILQPFVVSAVDLSQNLQNTEGSAFKILAAIYGLGVLISLGKLLFGFWKIKRLHRLAERLPMDDFTLMQVHEAIAPFSFFRWVFINLNLVEHADLQQIIMHERAHVRERHSIDVVFAEMLGVVFWWSPLVYFYTKSLKNVHEYAADAAVLRTSSPPQYGRLLLRQQQSGMSLSLTNPFFSQLKKRILMMTRNPSKRRALAKYALAVPIFLVLTLLLASPKTKVMATTEAATEKAVSSIQTIEKGLNSSKNTNNNSLMSESTSPQYNDLKAKLQAELAAQNSADVPYLLNEAPPQYFVVKDSADPVFAMVDEEPQFVGGRDSMFHFLGRTIKYPAQARESGIGGTVWIGFIVEKDGSLKDIKVKRNIPPSIDTIQSFKADGTKGGVKIVTNQNESLSDEAMRVVNLMPKWKAGRQKGAPVRVSYVLPIKFKLE
jgi:BlaR1 peptidase M56/Gram-negative bacterial TonB protein C-terminal